MPIIKCQRCNNKVSQEEVNQYKWCKDCAEKFEKNKNSRIMRVSICKCCGQSFEYEAIRSSGRLKLTCDECAKKNLEQAKHRINSDKTQIKTNKESSNNAVLEGVEGTQKTNKTQINSNKPQIKTEQKPSVEEVVMKADGTLTQESSKNPWNYIEKAIEAVMATDNTKEIKNELLGVNNEKIDMVNNPPHYKLPGLDVESYQIVKAVLSKEEFAGWCRGNILKYQFRAGRKGNKKEDLEKANKYTAWLEETLAGMDGEYGV